MEILDSDSTSQSRLIESKHTRQLSSRIRQLVANSLRIRYTRARDLIAFQPNMALAVASILVICVSGCLAAPHVISNANSNNEQQIQSRMGGLEPGDYVDDAGELDVMANQQQIPTAQLMAAAGHIVPENFFLPGGSIPALYPRFQQHQQQQHHQSQQHPIDPMHQLSSHLHARHIKYLAAARQADLMAAASSAPEQHDANSVIDYNGYNLVEGRDPNGQVSPSASSAIDLAEFLNPAASQSIYEQQQHQQQHYADQQAMVAELATLAAMSQQQQQQHQQQQQQQQHQDNVAQPSENEQYSNIGPVYQIAGQSEYGQSYEKPEKPYGLPTKSSSKEPSGMLKPLGNPKTVSSPVIDFVANQLPKTSNLEKLADKLPQMQTPTVFSFSSSKDPTEKVKAVNQKKRNVMRQAEQLAKMMIKSVNDKFGTTIGDQTDIPFLLSTLGPLGLAQNILFDPSLLITLLNSAEKTYFSDVLPGPAKMAMRPVLNIFRVPNKKRDKANLLNIISFIASGGQTPSAPNKHRQGTGVEKANKGKSR